MMFPATNSRFQIALKKYGEDAATAVYEMPYPGLDKPLVQRQVPYLGSFLSTQDGVMGFATALNGDTPVIRITYVKDVLDDDKIWEILQTPKWKIHYTNGTTKEIDATLTFKTPGKTVE